MKETSPLANRDFILRIKEIMKQDNFLLGIGDISRATGVSQRKLRYWEEREYIKPAKCCNVALMVSTENTLILRWQKSA